MENKVNEIYNCLKIMDMMLCKYTYDPPHGVVPFKSTQEMAEYFRQFLQVILPEEYQYNKE